jgi:hypothetical protein
VAAVGDACRDEQRAEGIEGVEVLANGDDATGADPEQEVVPVLVASVASRTPSYCRTSASGGSGGTTASRAWCVRTFAISSVVARCRWWSSSLSRFPRASALSLRFGLSAYDAACLEVALRLQLPIATLDAALRDAGLTSGVGLVEG